MPGNKARPLLQPYARRISSGWVWIIVIFLILFIMLIGGIPIFIIYAECCNPQMTIISSGSAKIVWEVATLFFAISSIVGFLIASAFINEKVDQGRWLSSPGELSKTSGRRIPFVTGKYIGRAIISLLFLISASLGTATIYSLFGFLTGGAIAFLMRSIQDLALDIEINTLSEEVTQRSMQKYLEEEYGTVMWSLLKEARKDPNTWRQQVRTQRGLEEWAETTRKKLGYPPHPGKIERSHRKRKNILGEK